MQKISIIIPVIRPQNVKNLVKLIKENAGVPRDNYEILIEEDKDRIGAPKMVKKLADKAKHDLIMFLGDDCEPLPNFLSCALETMESFQGKWGLVGLYDIERPGDHSPAHWLAHKRLLQFSEEFFHTGYIHQYCDNELCLWAYSLNRYRLNKLAKVNHHHPGFKDKSKTFTENIEASNDNDIKKVYSDEVCNHDKKLFEKRREIIIRRTHKCISLGMQSSMLATSLAIMGMNTNEVIVKDEAAKINMDILNKFNCSFKHPDLPENFEDDPRLDYLYDEAYKIKEFIIDHPVTMATLPFWRKAFTILPIFINSDIGSMALSLLKEYNISITESKRVWTEYVNRMRKEISEGMHLAEFDYEDYIRNPVPYIKKTYSSFKFGWMYDKSREDRLKEFVNSKSNIKQSKKKDEVTKKLNLGSGLDKKIDNSWVHIDLSPLGNPDYVWDITKGLPQIEDNSIGFVKADNIMEHLGDKFIDVMKEVHRVCKNKAMIWIRVPHVDGVGAFQDPTHNKFFNDITFSYFDCENAYWKKCGRLYGIPKFELISQKKDNIFLVVELKVIK